MASTPGPQFCCPGTWTGSGGGVSLNWIGTLIQPRDRRSGLYSAIHRENLHQAPARRGSAFATAAVGELSCGDGCMWATTQSSIAR